MTMEEEDGKLAIPVCIGDVAVNLFLPANDSR
jgi:hypothetical protein